MRRVLQTAASRAGRAWYERPRLPPDELQDDLELRAVSAILGELDPKYISWLKRVGSNQERAWGGLLKCASKTWGGPFRNDLVSVVESESRLSVKNTSGSKLTNLTIGAAFAPPGLEPFVVCRFVDELNVGAEISLADDMRLEHWAMLVA